MINKNIFKRYILWSLLLFSIIRSDLSLAAPAEPDFYFSEMNAVPAFPYKNDSVKIIQNITTKYPDIKMKLKFYSADNPEKINVVIAELNSKSLPKTEYSASVTAPQKKTNIIYFFEAELPENKIIKSPEYEIFFREDEEIRAVWADAYNSGFLAKNESEKMINWLKRTNYNIIIPEVRKMADAYYKSKYELMADNIKDKNNYDPLQTIIDLCKDAEKEGIKISVIPWIVVYKCGIAKSNTDIKFPQTVKREWLTQNKEGNIPFEERCYIDPGVPEASDYLLKVALDLIGSYDINSINLDYIRYPGKQAGYNPKSVERFKIWYNRSDIPEEGDEEWAEFRRLQVEHFIRRLSIEAKLLKPDFLLSVDTTSYGDIVNNDFSKTEPYGSVFQDWDGWIKRGIIDINFRMGYRREDNEKHARSYRDWVAFALSNQSARMVCIGQGAYFNTMESTINQIKFARENKAPGLIQYSYASMSKEKKNMDEISDILKREVFQKPAALPPFKWLTNPMRSIVYGRLNADAKIKDGAKIYISGSGIYKFCRADWDGFYGFFDLPAGEFELSAFNSKDVFISKQKISIIKPEIKKADLF